MASNPVRGTLTADKRMLAIARAVVEERVETLYRQVTEGELGRLRADLSVQIAETQHRTETRLDRLEAVVERLAEAQQRTEARLEQLAEAQQRTEARLEQLVEAQQRTEARLEQLAEAQQRTEAELRGFKETVERFVQATGDHLARLDQITGRLQGMQKEQFYRDRAATIFGLVLRKGRDATRMVVETVETAVDEGRISKEEGRDILRADLLWRGEYRGRPLILVGEISVTISEHDVERAERRAALLRKIGFDTVPFVGGEQLSAYIESKARVSKVVWATDGQLDEANWEAILNR